MSYRTQTEGVVAAFSNTINGLSIGNTSLGTTDPNMRFLPCLVIFENVALTGVATGAPTLSCGITGAAFTDIAPANNNANLEVLHGIGRANLNSSATLTIAPGSQIFCRVSVAGTGASVLTVRYAVIGVYY